MDITVLGKSPSWPDSGGASTGYLIREDGYTLLLDCGTGVYAKLREHIDYRALDAIVITHLHSDHVSDLVPFSFALAYSQRGTGHRPALHMPPGSREFLERLSLAWGLGSQFDDVFALLAYTGGEELELGPLTVRFCEVPHFVQSFAVDVSGGGAGRFTFGADCASNDALAQFARGTDLLMLEATEVQTPQLADGRVRGHMTAREAGELALRAEARRLVVTHYSDELDAAVLRSEAQAGFGAPVELATEGAHFAV